MTQRPRASDNAAPTPTIIYWQSTRRMTMVLLGLWFVITFTVVFFARELDQITLLGWPLSFYMAAQGAMLLYLAIVVIYTIRMRRAEQQLHADNEQIHGDQ
jgi:putative solute:sodium symporter small subunit